MEVHILNFLLSFIELCRLLLVSKKISSNSGFSSHRANGIYTNSLSAQPILDHDAKVFTQLDLTMNLLQIS